MRAPFRLIRAELIQNKNFESLIKLLRKKYDYIIVDTPPIGLVTDALQMEPFLDGLFYVTRFNYTNFESISFLDDQYRQGELNNVGLVLMGLLQVVVTVTATAMVTVTVTATVTATAMATVTTITR